VHPTHHEIVIDDGGYQEPITRELWAPVVMNQIFAYLLKHV